MTVAAGQPGTHDQFAFDIFQASQTSVPEAGPNEVRRADEWVRRRALAERCKSEINMVLARRGLQGTCGRGPPHPDQVAADMFRILTLVTARRILIPPERCRAIQAVRTVVADHAATAWSV